MKELLTKAYDILSWMGCRYVELDKIISFQEENMRSMEVEINRDIWQ